MCVTGQPCKSTESFTQNAQIRCDMVTHSKSDRCAPIVIVWVTGCLQCRIHVLIRMSKFKKSYKKCLIPHQLEENPYRHQQVYTRNCATQKSKNFPEVISPARGREQEEREGWEERKDVTDRGKNQKWNISNFQNLILFQWTETVDNSGYSWQADEAKQRGHQFNPIV